MEDTKRFPPYKLKPKLKDTSSVWYCDPIPRAADVKAEKQVRAYYYKLIMKEKLAKKMTTPASHQSAIPTTMSRFLTDSNRRKIGGIGFCPRLMLMLQYPECSFHKLVCNMTIMTDPPLYQFMNHTNGKTYIYNPSSGKWRQEDY